LLIDLKEFPLFIQERGITLDKFRFKMLKFKTIPTLPSSVTERKIFLKPRLAKYISPFSKFLRLSGFDEIPQLYNVLWGNMSLVGPRPLMLSDIEILKKESQQEYYIRSSFNSKPGLTGLWQLFGNRFEGVRNMIELEKLYEINKSTLFDLKLLGFTFEAILKRKNSDAIFSNENKKFEEKTKSTEFITNTTIRVKVYNGKNLKFLNLLKHENESYSIILPDSYWSNTSLTNSKTAKPEKHAKIYDIKDTSEKNKSA
jgi:exopolysaccharide production protein ExoY